jgi:hypothetical protein
LFLACISLFQHALSLHHNLIFWGNQMEKDLFEEDKTDEKADESVPEDVELFKREVEGDEQVDETASEPLNDEDSLLFEDEEGLADEKIEFAPDEDEAWIPLGSEGKGESSEEELVFEDEKEMDIDGALKGKEDEKMEIDKAVEDIEREELSAEEVLDKEGEEIIEEFKETAASDGEKEKRPSDDETWIPLGDDEIGLSPEEEQSVGAVKELGKEKKAIARNDKKDEDEIPGAEQPKEFTELIGEEPEAPPWEEGVEIPAYGEGDAPRKKKSIVFFGLLVLVGLIAVAFVYLFFESGPMPVKMEKEGDKAPSFVTRKMEEAPTKAVEPAPVETPVIVAPSEQVVEKVNSAPIISGNPVTNIVEGTAFSFTPQASDPDAGDKLMFFVTNQPAWMSFDSITGTLMGTPGQGDVGVYKNIVILTSDGTATASLPAFDLTVTGAKVEVAKTDKTDIKQANTEAEKKPVKEKDLNKAPVEKEVESKKSEGPNYLIPDLKDLLRKSEFQKAAKAYHNKIKGYSNTYSLKLEVVCLDESVQLAFEKCNFDRRMFILPRQMKDRQCFAVFWGIYGTQKEALEATQTIPAFFGRQATKPQLVLIKQYL